MISQTAEYALRAIVFISMAKNESLTTQDIAAATRVPPGYLAKVLQGLARAGFLTSQRGLRGGFRLARAPETLTVLDVIDAVDPIRRIHTCPLGLSAHGTKLCALHRRIDEATAQIQATFGSTTIKDLLTEDGDIQMLCEFPKPESASR